MQQSPTIELIDLQPDYISFILCDTDSEHANSLRRAILSEVPTLAIDHVVFTQNNSVLADEFIAHRLGLIPLYSSTASEFNDLDKCDCEEGCKNCQVVFDLDVKATTSELNVTADDLKIVSQHNATEVGPVKYDYPIIIAKLGIGQQLKFTAVAKRGTAQLNAKWGPACGVSFQYDPKIRINTDILEKMDQTDKEEWVNSCPKKVFQINSDAPGGVEVVLPRSCVYCNECVLKATEILQEKPDLANSAHNLVSVRQGTNRFIFEFESTGVMPPELILTKALDALISRIETNEYAIAVL